MTTLVSKQSQTLKCLVSHHRRRAVLEYSKKTLLRQLPNTRAAVRVLYFKPSVTALGNLLQAINEEEGILILFVCVCVFFFFFLFFLFFFFFFCTQLRLNQIHSSSSQFQFCITTVVGESNRIQTVGYGVVQSTNIGFSTVPSSVFQSL